MPVTPGGGYARAIPLEAPFVPRALRTVPSDSLALLKQVTAIPAGACQRYIDSNWPDPVSFGTPSQANLRPPAAMAYGLALTVATGTNNISLSSSTDAQMISSAIRIISAFATTHAANGGTWGGVPVTAGAHIYEDFTLSLDWQGAMWVTLIGIAAKLLWANLSNPQRSAVTAMVQLEADRFLVYTVPYLRDGVGRVLDTPGDTKGEENAWNAWILMLAAGWWPTHAHAQQWLSKGLELCYAAAATPRLPINKHPHNGLTGPGISAGSNVAMDGTAPNHNVNPHPNYMASITNQVWANGWTFAWLTGKFPAVCQAAGLQRLYRAMMDIPFTGYYSPGPIYDVTHMTSAINWPAQLTDGFSPTVMQSFMAMDGLAHTTGCDALASIPAATWLNIHATDQAGRTGLSEWDLQNSGWVVFADWLLKNNTITVSNADAATLLA